MSGIGKEASSPAGRATFRNFFRPEDMAWFVAHYAQEDRGGHDGYFDRLGSAFHPALRGFLDALRQEGVLEPIPGSSGRRGTLIDAWNGMVTSDDSFRSHPELAWERIVEWFAHDLVFGTAYRAAEPGADAARMAEASAAAYETIVRRVDAGTFSWHEIREGETCATTGDRLKVETTGWKLRMGGIDTKTGRLVPMKPVERAAIREATFDFPTGDLLVADWFRLDAFNEAADSVKVPSLGSADGREAVTRAYARELGFLSVAVGNTSPTILEVDDALVFGWVDQDAEHGEDAPKIVGEVCTDMWRTTIIEHGRLVDMVAASVGREEAVRMVDEYVAENGVARIRVEPGTHHVYFGGREEEDFGDDFASDDLDVPTGIRPIFVLSPRPLSLREPVASEAGRDGPSI